MNDKSWIKLYRKILLKGLIRDHSAYILFTYLLLKCNKEGKVLVSRYSTSKELALNPSTYKSALKRLEEKWQSVTTSVTNKYTLVQIVNWTKYQGDDVIVTTSDATTSPPGHHLVTTYNKNREIRIENNINNNSVTSSSRTSKCPLDVKDSPLREKYPNGHKECTEFIDSVGELKGHKFANYPKQIGAVHKMLRAGFDFEKISTASQRIMKKKFYVDNGWDLATVAAELDKA